MKVTFKDLSKPLKAAIIMAWIVCGIYCLALLIGLIQGLRMVGEGHLFIN